MKFKLGSNIVEQTKEDNIHKNIPEGWVKGKKIYYRNHTGPLSSSVGVIGKNLYIAKIDPITGVIRPDSEILTRLNWDEKKQEYRDQG